MLVHENRSFEHLKAGICQKSCGRTDSDCKDYHIGVKCAVVSHHLLGFGIAFDSCQAGGGQHAHAGGEELFLRIVSHFLVVGVRHNLGRSVNDRYLHALCHQVLRHLKADEPGAANHCLPAFLFFYVRACRHGIVRGAHAEHAGKPYAVYGRNEGDSPCCNDEFVIGFRKCLAGGFFQGNGLSGAVDARRLTAGEDLCAGKTAVTCRSVDNQAFTVCRRRCSRAARIRHRKCLLPWYRL